MATVASTVTETFAGLTAEGNRIYNINALMTCTVAAEDTTTITCTKLRKIKGTPGLFHVANDSGGALYITSETVSGNVITIVLSASPGNPKKMRFAGQVIGV